ncbi:MAG: hypothetical protein ACOC1O_04095 [bacterium]
MKIFTITLILILILVINFPVFAEMDKSEMEEQTKINLETYIKEQRKAERKERVDKFLFGIGTAVLFSIFLK